MCVISKENTLSSFADNLQTEPHHSQTSKTILAIVCRVIKVLLEWASMTKAPKEWKLFFKSDENLAGDLSFFC